MTRSSADRARQQARFADDTGSRGKIAWRTWLRWYVGTLGLGVTVSFAGAAVSPFNAMRYGVLYGALLYFAAALGRPRNAFLMLRNVGWFSSIRSDRSVRWVMVVIAVLLTGCGIFFPFEGFR